MRSVAGVALTTSAIFLLIVAVMLNSPALFYMSTAMIALIGALRLQAFLAVRALHFERFAPEKAQVGELVTIELVVWSDRRIRRPLVTVSDILPGRLITADRTASLPIAPAFDVPIRTQYKFRPLRRGRFRWANLRVVGTDALGMIVTSKEYSGSPTDLLVVPIPLQIDIDLPAASGWGTSESEHGQARGAGIEPRGVREYASGDSMRYIHWRSSARSAQLLVKEFEAGSHASVAFVIQRSKGSEIGMGADTTLEQMCSHVAYLSERLLRTGAQVLLPTVEGHVRVTSAPHERQQQVLAALAEIEPIENALISDEAITALADVSPGSLLYLLISVQDAMLPQIIPQLTARRMKVAVMIYNPDHFPTPKKAPKVQSAADDVYVEMLRSAGAEIVMVQRQEIA